MESNENMQEPGGKLGVQPVLIEEELKTSFLDYAMSVVISRAIPDIRDGLKPVHRRVLYTMYQLGFFYNKPYHKSVRVVGEVLGKYHPHGDQAVYNTMVGMVQDFSKRYPLLDGQGNWGSVDGDNAAAMRYTEVRMAKIAAELLADLDKETVPFVPNFDDSTVEPTVLPSRIPNLLVNGTSGIAVGMATSIPPHNLGEVIDACLVMLAKNDISDEELFALVPAPDFPTGGIICGRSGIVQAYKTGRGNLVLRGVVDIEESKKGTQLIITELPYQVNKAELAIKIAELVRNKIIDGITNIRDESDKKGMRLVIELRRAEVPQVVLNQLYKHTSLQTSVSILMLGLLDNRPLVFNLRQLLEQFLIHRKEIIYHRTVFDLGKAEAREHILAGFIIALSNIDETIALIKQSKTAEDAIASLNKRFLLSFEQGKAILEMRLQRLTGLEQEKIHQEMEELKKEITYLKSILDNEQILKKEILKELNEVKEQYADKRKSRVEGAIDMLTEADLIPDDEVVVTLTLRGYVKRVALETYGVQHRGGKGKMGMTSLDNSEDVYCALSTGNSDIVIATAHGQGIHFHETEVRAMGRQAAGVIGIRIKDKDYVVGMEVIDGTTGELLFVTSHGYGKRVSVADFRVAHRGGVGVRTIPTDKRNGNVIGLALIHEHSHILLIDQAGKIIRLSPKEVRTMGRQAKGVRLVRLDEGQQVSAVVAFEGQEEEVQ